MYKSSHFRSINISDNCILREGETPAPEGTYGFVLIDNEFVPYEFIKQIEANLKTAPTQYGSIVDAENFVNYDFWLSLEDYERKLVGPCLLILIERGIIYLTEGFIQGKQLIRVLTS